MCNGSDFSAHVVYDRLITIVAIIPISFSQYRSSSRFSNALMNFFLPIVNVSNVMAMTLLSKLVHQTTPNKPTRPRCQVCVPSLSQDIQIILGWCDNSCAIQYLKNSGLLFFLFPLTFPRFFEVITACNTILPAIPFGVAFSLPFAVARLILLYVYRVYQPFH